MSRAAVFVASLGVLCQTVPAELRAEPIRVTGGSLVFGPAGLGRDGALSLFGTRGFSLEGGVISDEGRVDPLTQCIPCEAGSTISVGGSITGPAFSGTATLDGHTYSDLNDDTLHHFVDLEWSGTIKVPSWRDAPVTISAPFHMQVSLFNTVSPDFNEGIETAGRATLALVPNGPGIWEVGPLRYDIVATATPEPATLTMIGGPLVAALIRTRTRRRRKVGIQLSTFTRK